MMDWNPNNKRFLYFHFTTTDGSNEYLKVDCIEHKVFKATVTIGTKRGRPWQRGLYELKWMTFLSNYLHFGDEIKYKQITKKFGVYEPYKKLKYTTENQYLQAIRVILTDFVKT